MGGGASKKKAAAQSDSQPVGGPESGVPLQPSNDPPVQQEAVGPEAVGGIRILHREEPAWEPPGARMMPIEQWDRMHDVFAWLNWSPPKGSPCYAALRKHFPGALPDRAMHDRAVALLTEYGFEPESTLLGSSICPDEINNEPGDISDMMKEYWGGVFPLGGIGGPPFVGKTGFGAFSSHVPVGGNIFMFFGPHVAVSEAGEVGKYLRDGQENLSTACGACIGAYSACCKLCGCDTFAEKDFDEGDLQMDWIKKALEPHVGWIQKQVDPLAALAYKSYEAVQGLTLKIVHTNFSTGKLALLGGIQLNMPDPYQDHFVPLFFEVRQQGRPAIDLMQDWSQALPYQPGDLLEEDALARSQLFSWLQWTPMRDAPVTVAIEKAFAGSVPGRVLHSRTLAVLQAEPFGFTTKNTLVGTSVCPDEINNESGDLNDLLKSYWGATFPLGGISGLPHVGKTGFKAFSSHVPDNGNVMIVFGPHVAISSQGEVGKYLRQGQCNESSSCGAVIGAYNFCCQPATVEEPKIGICDSDMQMDCVKRYILRHAGQISMDENPMAALALQAFQFVKDGVQQVVDTNFGSGHLALIGGVQINMPEPYEDHFLPLFFEVRRAGEEPQDLLGSLR